MPSVLLLLACGPDLDRLETQERALEQEVAALRQSVEAMRARMVEMGLEPAAPDARSPGSGAADLSGSIPVRVTRTGDPPTFPGLGSPERRTTTDCGWRFSTPWLEPLSDTTLEQSGSGRSSPVVLALDGRALTPHATPATSEKACGYAFRHGPRYLFFAPDGGVDAVVGTWTVGLDAAVPIPRGGDGRPAYWVYPGTALTFEMGAGWDAAAWGELTVQLDARVLYVSPADPAAPRPTAPVTVSFLGQERRGQDRVFGFAERPPPPDGPWNLLVSSPPDGPYVLLETLVVGNRSHARGLLSGPAE